MGKKIRYRLSNPKEVRRVLANVTNKVANNEMDPKQANAIAYLCNCILQSIRFEK